MAYADTASQHSLHFSLVGFPVLTLLNRQPRVEWR
jgi:hypothetical protein